MDVKSDDGGFVLPPLTSPALKVEDDEGIETLEACDAKDAIELVKICPVVPLVVPVLIWQLRGTTTGVASTAVIDVVVLIVKERPGNAG